MANFDTLLSGLHDFSTVADTSKAYLEVNSKREFIPTNNFDTVIGYEGDINSQVILFKLPETYDSHKLSECQIKLVKWKNKVSGFEGTSNLIFDGTYYKWEVDPSVFIKTGTIEISLTFEDKSGDVVVYSWNTSTYLELSVGASIVSVDYNFPAKDEILTVDRDTRNILAPRGYDNTVCMFGEKGVSNVYFLVNRYLGRNNSLDVLSEDTIVTIYISLGKGRMYTTEIEKRLVTSEIEGRNKEGLVLIEWQLPEQVTCNAEGYVGNFDIAIAFNDTNMTWLSNTYKKLMIGDSLLKLSPGEIVIPDNFQ
jgi:hypothetical protein